MTPVSSLITSAFGRQPVAHIPHFASLPPYRWPIALAEHDFEPEPDYGPTDEVMLAELRAAKVEYLHAAVDALAAVELWLALDAWIPEKWIPEKGIANDAA